MHDLARLDYSMTLGRLGDYVKGECTPARIHIELGCEKIAEKTALQSVSYVERSGHKDALHICDIRHRSAELSHELAERNVTLPTGPADAAFRRRLFVEFV